MLLGTPTFPVTLSGTNVPAVMVYSADSSTFVPVWFATLIVTTALYVPTFTGTSFVGVPHVCVSSL